MNKIQKQSGFSIVALGIILVIVGVIGFIGFTLLNKTSSNESNTASNNSAQNDTKSETVKIKHIGVNLGTYNPATNMAGDFKFTKEKMSFNQLFFEFGFAVPANSAGPAKTNPQPTYILPLGTKVHALIDGEVVDTPKLYSNDYSIMMRGEGSELIFETEHVMNLKVKKGDKVKAGDVIAEVSDYDAKNYAGMGLVEIGILKGGNPPSHLCPFDYLDDSIKDETLANLKSFKASWEEYIGSDSVYDETNTVSPGCITLDPIEG